MTELYLRPAQPVDLDDIMRHEVAGFVPGTREEGDVYHQRISAFPQGSLMALLNDRSIGCLFSEIWNYRENLSREDFILGHDIRDRHQPQEGSELYISSMTIDPDYRHQGHGHTLFNQSVAMIADHFPAIESVVLLVNQSWMNARAIYKKSGFQEIGIVPDFFQPDLLPRENGLIMRKFI